MMPYTPSPGDNDGPTLELVRPKFSCDRCRYLSTENRVVVCTDGSYLDRPHCTALGSNRAIDEPFGWKGEAPSWCPKRPPVPGGAIVTLAKAILAGDLSAVPLLIDEAMTEYTAGELVKVRRFELEAALVRVVHQLWVTAVNCDSAFADDSHRGPRPFVDLIYNQSMLLRGQLIDLLDRAGVSWQKK